MSAKSDRNFNTFLLSEDDIGKILKQRPPMMWEIAAKVILCFLLDKKNVPSNFKLDVFLFQNQTKSACKQ